jgi:hypothetical protein
MYNIGDKFQINNSEFTIWFIEGGTYHLINNDGLGICCDEEYIINNMQ